MFLLFEECFVEKNQERRRVEEGRGCLERSNRGREVLSCSSRGRLVGLDALAGNDETLEPGVLPSESLDLLLESGCSGLELAC